MVGKKEKGRQATAQKLSKSVQALSVVLAIVGLVFFFITVIHFEYTQSQPSTEERKELQIPTVREDVLK